MLKNNLNIITMKTNTSNSRRKFISSLTSGAVAATGLAFLPNALHAHTKVEKFGFGPEDLITDNDNLDEMIKKIGKKSHPLAYDMSSVSPWGLIWSNVYYITNEQTGTTPNQVGLLNVLRHHGMIYGLNDETIKKYKLGEFLGLNDPKTNAPALKNPYYEPEDGVFPLPGLAGIKGLQEKGAQFCICDMARKVYSQFVGQKHGVDQSVVYEDFVKGTLPGIKAAPSGVWALGRLGENNISYIDASVG